MKDSPYYKQAELLLKVLPIISKDEALALKGGTAINFFVRDLPRLSVDIDLVYLPLEDRDTTFNNLTGKLKAIKEEIVKQFQNANVAYRLIGQTNNLSGLLISSKDATIKIETNTIIRGTVYSPEQMTLCSKAEEIFELSLKTQCLSMPDLYGGKICAALDRQHPRDLYDIKLLFENEGITEQTRKAFLVYLISHNRPMAELLNPNYLDISKIYEQEFIGMTDEKVSLIELNESRKRLVEELKKSLTEAERKFLISFKTIEPEWNLVELPNIENLPAVNWKLMNLKKMDPNKHSKAVSTLKKILFG